MFSLLTHWLTVWDQRWSLSKSKELLHCSSIHFYTITHTRNSKVCQKSMLSLRTCGGLNGVRSRKRVRLRGFAKEFLCSASVRYNWIYSIPLPTWEKGENQLMKTGHETRMSTIPRSTCTPFLPATVSCHGLYIWIRIRNSSQLSQDPGESDVCSCEQSVLTTLLMSSITMMDAQTG